MHKIGCLGQSLRTGNLIKQLESHNCINIGIYNNDEISGVKNVKRYSNPFHLIADADILLVSYSGDDTRGLLTECILESKTIILDNLHYFSPDDISYLYKLAKEAEVQVIPLYHSIYYSLIEEIMLHVESETFSIQVFINGTFTNKPYSIEEICFTFSSISCNLLNLRSNQHSVFTHLFKNSCLRQICLTNSYFDSKLFTLQIDETISKPEFKIVVSTATQKLVFDLIGNHLEIYQIIGNHINVVNLKNFSLLPELSYVLNKYYLTSNPNSNNHFLLYELKENLIHWHVVSDKITQQFVVKQKE